MQFLENTVELFRLPTQIKIKSGENNDNNNVIIDEAPSIAEKVGWFFFIVKKYN